MNKLLIVLLVVFLSTPLPAKKKPQPVYDQVGHLKFHSNHPDHVYTAILSDGTTATTACYSDDSDTTCIEGEGATGSFMIMIPDPKITTTFIEPRMQPSRLYSDQILAIHVPNPLLYLAVHSKLGSEPEVRFRYLKRVGPGWVENYICLPNPPVVKGNKVKKVSESCYLYH